MAALRDALAEVVVEDFEEAFTKRLPLPRTLHGSKIWPIVFSQGSCFFSGLQPTFPIGFTMDFLPILITRKDSNYGGRLGSFACGTLPLWPRCVGAWRVGKAMVDGVDLLGDSII